MKTCLHFPRLPEPGRHLWWLTLVLYALLVLSFKATAEPDNDLWGYLIAGRLDKLTPTVRTKIEDRIEAVWYKGTDSTNGLPTIADQFSRDFCAVANTNITVVVGWFPRVRWQGGTAVYHYPTDPDYTTANAAAVELYVGNGFRVWFCRKSQRWSLLQAAGVRRKPQPEVTP